MVHHARIACSLAGLVFLVGCNPWYLVESEFHGVTLEEKPPEIARTVAHHAAVMPGITVALSAPDRCANQSAATATGEATLTGDVLGTTCGVEMADLERSLVKAGYRVISWSVVSQTVRHGEGITTLDAARKHGAKVLFQVNSLERSVVNRGSELQWERRFFESGPDGTKGPVASVPEERALALERGVEPLEAAVEPPRQVSVTMNATAILVETGEAIWFYTWTHSDKSEGTVVTSQLFECHRRHLFRCLPKVVQSPPVSSPPPRSGSKGSLSTPPQSADPIDAAYYRLVQEVVQDLVAKFRAD
jgi:hypothetical protein